jgi:uncharacterized protein (UPF0335 family)
MSGEPGFNLSSVLVADRNAKAAIQICEGALKAISSLVEKVARLEQENVLLHQELQQVRMIAALKVGSGPTTRG